MHKLIVMSQTYQQSSTYREDAANVDGAARLLWRFPPRRLSAEEIRDTMLFVAGKLDEQMADPVFGCTNTRATTSRLTRRWKHSARKHIADRVSSKCSRIADRFAIRFRRARLRLFSLATNSNDDAIAGAWRS